jgi:hypothetical protein
MATQCSQRQNIKAIESHAGSTQAMPDNRVLLTLDDGRSFVIDAERMKPQTDGTYLVEIIAADSRLPAVRVVEEPRTAWPSAPTS